MEDDEKKIDASYYDRSDYYHKSLTSLSNLESPFQKYRIKKVSQIYLPGKNERVLDLGCGWGTLTFALAPFVKEIVGIDFSKKSIEICNDLAHKQRSANIQFVCADACHTGFPPENFDAIISADLFEHVYPDDFERMLDECYRILRNGGKFSIWTPCRGHILEILKNRNFIFKRDVSHVDYKSMERLVSALEERGFVIVKRYYVESHVLIVNFLEKMLQPFVPCLRRRIAILAEKRSKGSCAFGPIP